MIKSFKFLKEEKPLQYGFFRFTNIYNRLDTVQLPWKEYQNTVNNPKIFRGSFIQFVAKYRNEGFVPVIYEIELRRGGWFATHYSISRMIDRRILKNDNLIICYDTIL